jgi:hypothetical protein
VPLIGIVVDSGDRGKRTWSDIRSTEYFREESGFQAARLSGVRCQAVRLPGTNNTSHPTGRDHWKTFTAHLHLNLNLHRDLNAEFIMRYVRSTPCY